MNQIESDDDGEIRDIQALLEAVYRHYHYDFRDYACPSIGRRILNSVRTEGLQTIPELTRKLFDEPACMERFLEAVTVNVTAMFRDPDFYRTFRTQVVPQLRPLPLVRIWHAGCSTGQEVYSLAILLEEEGTLRSDADLRDRRESPRLGGGAERCLSSGQAPGVHRELPNGGRHASLLGILHGG
jgi:hypothetical protein